MTSFARYYKDKTLVEISTTEIDELIKDKKNQALIAEYVYERLYNRFLKIFDFSSKTKAEYDKNGSKVCSNIFNEEYKNGFLMMASCSLLIETFASFISGQNETPRGKSPGMFKNVFEYAENKNNGLKLFKDIKFYDRIRCGLLHQGEVYGNFKITRSGDTLFDDKTETINAILFFKELKKLLLEYKKDLATGEWDNKVWDGCRQKIRYIISNAN